MPHRGPIEATTLHFDLRHSGATVEYQLHCSGELFDLVRHDEASRVLACTKNAGLACLSSERLAQVTHYVPEFPLPADLARFVYVTKKANGLAINQLAPLVLSAVHIPVEAMRKNRMRSNTTSRARVDPRFAAFGIEHPGNMEEAIAILDGLDRLLTPRTAAQSVVFQHPQLATRDKDAAACVMNDHIAHADGLDALVSAISEQGEAGWAVSKPAVDVHGNEFKWSHQWGDRKGTTVYHYDLTATTIAATAAPASSACTTSQADTALQGKKWNVQQGQMNQHIDGKGPALAASAATQDFVLNSQTPGPGVGYDSSSMTFASGATRDDPGTFSIDSSNSFLRILWAWVQFVDHNGNTLDSTGNQVSSNHYEQIGIGVITSVNTIIAIPIPTPPSTLTFPWPENASTARIALGGPGGGLLSDDLQYLISVPCLLTVLFQYAVPLLFLAAGAALEDGAWYKGLLTKTLRKALIGSLKNSLESEGSAGPSLTSWASVLTAAASGIAGFIVTEAAEKIGTYVAVKLAAAEVIDSVPVVGWIARVASCVITAASMVETTVECVLSPSLYKTEVRRLVTLQVTVHPDPIKGTNFVPPTWPDVASGGYCLFQVQFKDGTGYSQRLDMPETTSADPIIGSFPNLPAGNKLQVVFGVYSKDNWLAGQWTSAWVDAVPPAPGAPLTIEGSIIESLARLTANTEYNYEQSLRWNGAQHIWMKDRPTALKKDLNCDTGLCKPTSLTINDKAYMLGYTWQSSNPGLPLCEGGTGSGQPYAFQSINIGATPEASLKFPSCLFRTEPALIYDQFGPAPLLTLPLSVMDALQSNTLSADIIAGFTAVQKTLPSDATVATIVDSAEWKISWPRLTDPAYVLRRTPVAIEVAMYPDPPFSPRNFYVDPRSGEFHLRQVTLDNSTPFDMQPTMSWGRFNFPYLDAFVVHPAGYVIGASFPNHRLDIIKLPAAAVPDKDAPLAVTVAGKGLRQGLLNGPTALAVSSDGRVLVLEAGNERVQSFDVNGNPAPSFDSGNRGALHPAGGTGALDARLLPLELRKALAANGVELTGRWSINNRADKVEITVQGDELVIRLNGAQMSTRWRIVDGATTYLATEENGKVVVHIPGGTDFTLPDNALAELNLGAVSADIVAAFKAQGLTLAPQSAVKGNGLVIPKDGPEASLDLGKVPVEVVHALATRSFTLGSNTTFQDDVSVSVLRSGAVWIVRDAGHAASYKLSLNADGSVTVVDYVSYFSLKTDGGRTYLSMSSELLGYMYILSYRGDGDSVNDYVLDVYEPSGAWLSATTGVNAAQLVVNQWRTVYTLDYQHFAGPGGRIEPSVSTWVPSETNS